MKKSSRSTREGILNFSPPTTTNKYRVPKKPAITLLAGGDDRETTFNHEIWVDSALGHI